MRRQTSIASAAVVLLTISLLSANSANALNFTGLPFIQFGDGQSYSLSISQVLAGCTQNNGCPYYVGSSPGQIQDLVVIATGANGNPVTTNFAGMDNAYPTPNGQNGAAFFSTGTVADPGGTNEFTRDNANTWDATLASLKTFLMTETPVFFFNNNQTNSGASTNQNLAAWAQLTITDNIGTVIGTYDFNNRSTNVSGPGDYKVFTEGGGGVLNGNVANYSNSGSGAGSNPFVGNSLGTPTDYVLSGGEICAQNGTPVPCSSPHNQTFNENLGANEAAYAIVFPEFNAQLANLFATVSDANLANYTFHMDLRLGCDPAYTTADACVSKSLNNGYEQLFLGRLESTEVGVVVPEPASFLLFGIGLISLVSWRKRQNQ